MAINLVSSSQALGVIGDVVPQQKEDRFEELVLALKDALGPSSGLTSEDIDVGFLMDLMRAYDGSDMQWSKYAFGDASRGYTRNLVDEGNGKSNLVGHILLKPRSGRAICYRPVSPVYIDREQNSWYSSGPQERAAPSTTTETHTAS